MDNYDIFNNVRTQRNLVAGNLNKIFSKSQDTDLGKHFFTKSEEGALNNLIQKGEISDTLASGYGPGSTSISFTKTGKEIKDRVPSILTALQIQKGVIEAKMAALVAAIGFVGTNSISRRYAKEMAIFRYDYKLCEPRYENGSYNDVTEENTNCSAYNSLAYLYCDVCDDIDAIKVIAGNVEDSKKYTLSVSQLIALNFTNDTIQKAEENDIEKGGEGSKGGKVIGHTKSGKAIYDKFNHPSHEHFSGADHKDAGDAHAEKARKDKNYNPFTEGEKHNNEYKESRKWSRFDDDEKNKVIGKTDSDKNIHDKFDHPNHKNFDSYDHSDAAQIHIEKMRGFDSKKDEDGDLNDKEDKKEYDNHWKQMGKHLEASKKLRKKESV